MKMNRLLLCLVLYVLQHQVLQMQQQMATERQHMQQERAGDEQMLQQQLKEMQQQMDTETQKRENVETMQHKMATEQQEMQQKMAAEKLEMQQKISNLEKENTNLKQSIETINHKLANNTLELREIGNVLKQGLSLENVSDIVNAKHNGSFIGFSAFANEPRNYSDSVTVLFQSVVTNVGSLYAPDTSIFTCGYEGYYLFSVSVHAAIGDSMFADIMMGGTMMATVYAEPTDQDTTSITVVVLCPQFNQVYVRCRGDSRRMYGQSTRMDSMFTGVLLLQQ